MTKGIVNGLIAGVSGFRSYEKQPMDKAYNPDQVKFKRMTRQHEEELKNAKGDQEKIKKANKRWKDFLESRKK